MFMPEIGWRKGVGTGAEVRLKHAFALLTAQAKSDVRICDVALQAGFSDISHFNRLFRARFGDTPKGVRARARKGSA